MSNARLRLAFASEKVVEPPGSPTPPPHPHRPENGQ